ncbi:MAG: cysteine--tRNA ligase [Deltaproteobacteria bacterium]|nr:cysteine--tRNA ligase [Deltaproteobacteria bacterium]
MLRVYNTLTDGKEEFRPIHPGEVKMYACGVTVYDHSHIGHARGAVVFDMIRRYLAYRGFSVTYVRNFTDVDDKIIKRSNEEGVAAGEIAERYIEEYRKDMAALGVERADIEPKATEHIKEIIDLVKKLVEKGHAYEAGGDVLFEVATLPAYGKLSKRKLDELQAGARVEVDEKKRSPLDFVLWKASKEGEPAWESPWGPGRPGWHIECSAMSQAHLGESIDIHGGGKDLIFPHHENEIAQSEAATGKPFVRYWLHNGFVNIDQEKMSKSLGNFFTIKEVLEKFNPEAVRLFLLTTHYRSPIDFSDRNLQDADRARRRIYNLLQTVDRLLADGGKECTAERDDGTAEVRREVEAMFPRFEEAMDDDFNTAKALGNLFEVVRVLNGAVQDLTSLQGTALMPLLRNFRENMEKIGAVLGLFREAPESVLKGNADESSHRIETMIEERLAARKNRDWAAADRIRDELAARGVRLKDRPDGTTDWEWER